MHRYSFLAMLTFKTNVHSFLVAFSLNTNNIFYTSLIKGSNKKNTKYICYWLFLTTSTRLDRSLALALISVHIYLFVYILFIRLFIFQIIVSFSYDKMGTFAFTAWPWKSLPREPFHSPLLFAFIIIIIMVRMII